MLIRLAPYLVYRLNLIIDILGTIQLEQDSYSTQLSLLTIVLMLTALDPPHHLLFSPSALRYRLMHKASVLIMCLGQFV
jgi:hypothetical protein